MASTYTEVSYPCADCDRLCTEPFLRFGQRGKEQRPVCLRCSKDYVIVGRREWTKVDVEKLIGQALR